MSAAAFRAWRTGLKLSQREAAEVLCCSRFWVQAIERGKGEPSDLMAQMMDAISEGFRPLTWPA